MLNAQKLCYSNIQETERRELELAELRKTQGWGAPCFTPSWLGQLENWPVCPGLEGSLKAKSAESRGRHLQSPRSGAVVRMGADGS